MNIYWTIGVKDAAPQWHLFALQSKGELYVSVNTKLVGLNKEVRLTTQELAKEFRDSLLPTMRLRHGEAVRLEIYHVQAGRVVSFDDALVQARIKEQCFAPNKKPASLQA